MKRQKPIAPSGRELSPQVTEGASGRETDGLLSGWYLIEVIDTPTSTAVTIPGFGGAVTTCISYPAKLTLEALRALASGAVLSCSGKKVRKEAGLRGNNSLPLELFPLKNPRVEPS